MLLRLVLKALEDAENALLSVLTGSGECSCPLDSIGEGGIRGNLEVTSLLMPPLNTGPTPSYSPAPPSSFHSSAKMVSSTHSTAPSLAKYQVRLDHDHPNNVSVGNENCTRLYYVQFISPPQPLLRSSPAPLITVSYPSWAETFTGTLNHSIRNTTQIKVPRKQGTY